MKRMNEAPARTLQIAWVDCTADTADVTIWDPLEHRVEIFHEDTGIPGTATDPGVVSRSRGAELDIIDRATELLQMAGYIVHAVEPHISGYAVIVEMSPG
jgi:hypothetical protein